MLLTNSLPFSLMFQEKMFKKKKKSKEMQSTIQVEMILQEQNLT